MKIVYSVLVALLYAALANAQTSISQPAHAVAIDSFARTMSRQSIVNMLGNSSLIDSIPSAQGNMQGRAKELQQMTFAPVSLYGFTSIGKVSLQHDSVLKAEFVLPYKARGNAKPREPYADQGFVHAKIDDFQKLLSAFVRQFGTPSVVAETVFEYFSSDGIPAIRAEFRDRVITVTVVQHGIL